MIPQPLRHFLTNSADKYANILRVVGQNHFAASFFASNTTFRIRIGARIRILVSMVLL
jgi:hypothetical protein